MAEAKLGWILFQLFGWPITVISFIGNIPPLSINEPYQTIISIFAIVFMVINVLRAREKWRKEKMENDDKSEERRKNKSKL